MNDFESVRAAIDPKARATPMPVVHAANAALDRIEAENERLRAVLEVATAVDEAAGLKGSAVKMTNALRALHATLNQEVK